MGQDVDEEDEVGVQRRKRRGKGRVGFLALVVDKLKPAANWSGRWASTWNGKP